MNWNADKSVRLSQACVIVFAALLAASALGIAYLAQEQVYEDGGAQLRLAARRRQYFSVFFHFAQNSSSFSS